MSSRCPASRSAIAGSAHLARRRWPLVRRVVPRGDPLVTPARPGARPARAAAHSAAPARRLRRRRPAAATGRRCASRGRGGRARQRPARDAVLSAGSRCSSRGSSRRSSCCGWAPAVAASVAAAAAGGRDRPQHRGAARLERRHGRGDARARRRRPARAGRAASPSPAALGALFLRVQGYEWVRLDQLRAHVASGVYGTTFYTLIGTHAAHVVGRAGLARRHRDARRPRPFPGRPARVLRACAIYWHFVVAPVADPLRGGVPRMTLAWRGPGGAIAPPSGGAGVPRRASARTSAYGDRGFNWAYVGLLCCRSVLIVAIAAVLGPGARLPSAAKRRRLRRCITRRRHESARPRYTRAVEPAETRSPPRAGASSGCGSSWRVTPSASAPCSPATALMRATSGDWPTPYARPRHQPHRADDLPAHLLERDDGEGAGVAGQGRPAAALRSYLFYTALGGAIFVEPAGLRVDAPDPSRPAHQRQPVGRLAVRHLVLHRHRLPRPARDRRRDLSAVDRRRRRRGGPTGGQLQRGRDRRPVLALRRPRLDHGLHLHVPPVGGRQPMASEHKHPNYMAIFWWLAILTVVELAVVFLPFGEDSRSACCCARWRWPRPRWWRCTSCT